MHPVIVHPESAENDLLIVLPKIMIKGKKPFRPQFKEHGVYKLNDVETAEPG